MLASSVPTKFQVPFAKNATTGYIRAIPYTTVSGVAASLSLGFPPATSIPVGSGGTPPNIEDFNGILFETTAWSQWQQAGAPVYYDSAFSSAIGGYPKGAVISVVGQNGSWWLSQVDNNTSNPDTGGANWSKFTPIGLGTAAYKATSNNSLPSVAAVNGATVVGHLAVFSDTVGTVQDGGSLGSFGTAASKTATDNTKTYLASVSGGTTANNVALFADGLGTVKNGGALGTAAFKNISSASYSNVAGVASSSSGQVVIFADSSGSIGNGGTLGNAAFKTVSNNGNSIVASVTGGITPGNFASFADGSGSVSDSGFNPSSIVAPILFSAIYDTTGSRGIGGVYGNGTGKAMYVSMTFFYSIDSNGYYYFLINGVVVMTSNVYGYINEPGGSKVVAGIVPPGGTYQLYVDYNGPGTQIYLSTETY